MTKNTVIPGLIILLMILSIVPVVPVYAARPLNTEDAPTNGRGIFQLEIGQYWTKMDDGERMSSQTYTVTYGITDNLDFGYEKPFYQEIPSVGTKYKYAGDSEISLKYRFMEETKFFPAIGVKAYTDLSDGDEMGTSGSTEYGAILFATKNFKIATFHLNLGEDQVRPNEGSDFYSTFTYSIAAEKPLSKKFTVVGEIVGASATGSAGPTLAQIGATYQFSPNITWDIGYTKGLNDYAPHSSVTTGITIQF
jgi:hypothetical protein